jgi:hypothetical protein
MGAFIDVSPLSDHNSRFEQSKDVSSISVADNRMFTINPSQSSRSTAIDDNENNGIPVYVQRKAKPAPSTTWKAPIPIPKSSSMLKANIESSLPVPELPPSKFLFRLLQNHLFSSSSSSSNNFLSTNYTSTYSIQSLINKYHRQTSSCLYYLVE